MEELKMQLGDALPGAVQVFAKALNLTEAQLFKQMEQGKLLAADVLPKVAGAYRKAAEEGGAYDLALKGLRVTEGKFLTESQRAGDKIFKSGFAAGLSDMYETLSVTLKKSAPQLKKIGKLFGFLFSALARGIEVVTPLIKLLINNFELLFGAAMIRSITSATAAMATFGTTSALAFATALAPVTALLAALATLDDMLAGLDDKRISLKEARQGYQIINGRQVGIEKREDGQYYSTKDIGGAGYFENAKQQFDKLSSGGGFSTAGIITSLAGFASKATGIGTTNTNTTKADIKLEVSIKDVPEKDQAEHIANTVTQNLSTMMSGGMVPQTR